MNQSERSITVVGGGPVGSLISLLLAKRKYNVQIYEGRPDPRTGLQEEGRSINLALSERGWLALKTAGVDISLREVSIPMYGRMMHQTDGSLQFQPYGKEGEAIYSVSRSMLTLALIKEAARFSNVKFEFSTRCTEVNLNEKTLTLQKRGHEPVPVKAQRLIAADGAFSAVRSAMQRTPRFNYSQYYIDYGYKELTIPAGAGGTFQLEKNALHIWPRGKFMLIALPNPDGSFTSTLFLPYEGPVSFAVLETSQQVHRFFEQYFPDVLPLMPSLSEEFAHRPTGSLVTVQCSPWSYGDFATLIGDAAHAIVPFYGQGMNAGFEDCRILAGLVDKYQDNWEACFAEYQYQRMRDTEAIARLAFQNFTEMRDKVGDPQFLLRKKIEAHMHKLFPAEWIPLYTMVTFSHIPYSEALRIGQLQEQLMDKVMATPDIATEWPNLDFEAIVTSLQEQLSEIAVC